MFARLLLSALLLLPATAAAQEAHPVWNYMGGGNDDEGWGTLSHDYATCDLGQNQSPVAIGETKTSAMSPLTIRYHSKAMTLQKKDRTLVVNMKGAGTASAQGEEYNLEEMRIHTPAEHEVVGRIYPAELHFIHRNAQGKTLIIAVFLELKSKGNEALQQLLGKAPANALHAVPLTLNPASLLPEKKGYYAYTGSLSWPPCTEGVEWRVLKEPVPISQKQMSILGDLVGRNARLLQPLYLRTIKATIN